jgi:hypothetical protein
MLQLFADKMYQNQLQVNERRNLCTLLTDLIYFIGQINVANTDSDPTGTILLSNASIDFEQQQHHTLSEPNRER